MCACGTTGEDFEGYWARRGEASAASLEAQRAGGYGCGSGGMRYAKPGKNIQIYFMSSEEGSAVQITLYMQKKCAPQISHRILRNSQNVVAI